MIICTNAEYFVGASRVSVLTTLSLRLATPSLLLLARLTAAPEVEEVEVIAFSGFSTLRSLHFTLHSEVLATSLV